MTGQAKTVTAAAAAIITSSDSIDQHAQLVRQYRQHDIHSDLASVPGHGAAAREYAADHEEEHDFLGPRDRNAEEVTADNVDEIDANAGDQEDPRSRARENKETTNTFSQRLDHSCTFNLIRGATSRPR